MGRRLKLFFAQSFMLIVLLQERYRSFHFLSKPEVQHGLVHSCPENGQQVLHPADRTENQVLRSREWCLDLPPTRSPARKLRHTQQSETLWSSWATRWISQILPWTLEVFPSPLMSCELLVQLQSRSPPVLVQPFCPVDFSEACFCRRNLLIMCTSSSAVDPEMCTFGLSGCREAPAASGPPGSHTTAREPKRTHSRAPAFENTTKIQREDTQREREREKKKTKFWAHPSGPPFGPTPPFGPHPPFGKFHEKTPRERQKERKWGWEREKKVGNFGLPTLEDPTLRGRFFLGLGSTLWSSTMTHTRLMDWPKLDWPKLAKSGWPKRDWPKSVPSGLGHPMDPVVSVQKQKLHKKHREACKSSWSQIRSPKSFTLTIPWIWQNLWRSFLEPLHVYTT